MNNFDYLQNTSFHNEVKDNIASGRVGIEKESFRCNGSEISKNPHPKLLGSALCNKYITTDFSESLLEFVTDPYENVNETMDFLDNIHLFVLEGIGSELLWPFSIPPYVKSSDDILIANYGTSNLAKFKRIYRNGLSNRYGRIMQAISGIHFNYSLHPEVLSIMLDREKSITNEIKKDDLYFRTIRNLTKLNWLILYLFGSSPIVNKNFLEKDKKQYREIKDIYIMSDATSLRMSDIGYNVIGQKKLDISLNSLEDYLYSLSKYTKSINPKFEKIIKTTDVLNSQINAAFLQTEDEYYATARPKSSSQSESRMINKLKQGGIDYLELRSVDINPFEKGGIGVNDLKFLEAFMIFCTFSDSPKMSFDEINLSKANDLNVSLNGRKQGLILVESGKRITIEDWALKIFDQMQPIFEMLSIEKLIVDKYKNKILDKSLTHSARLVKKLEHDEVSFHELGLMLAKEHRSAYQKLDCKNHHSQSLLKNETIDSLTKQEKIESRDEIAFNEYLSRYLES